MKIINKTENIIHLILNNESVYFEPTENACNVIYNETEIVGIFNLPEIKSNTLYIVSQEVLNSLNQLSELHAIYERSDIIAIHYGIIPAIKTINELFCSFGILTTNYFEQMNDYINSND